MKNFRLLVRARVSAAIIFIGPLLLVSLLGFAYSHSSGFTLSASVFSEDFSGFSKSLTDKMTNQNFRIEEQPSLENCIRSVKRGETQACIVFPPGMEADGETSAELTFYVDYSQINLVWLMLDVMSARVSERSQEVSKELTADLLERLWFTEAKITEGMSSVSSIGTTGSTVKEKSEKVKSGIKSLDISVDFEDIGISTAKDFTAETTGLIGQIELKMLNLSNSTEKELNSIESSAAKLQDEAGNDSSMEKEIDDIDDAADNIDELMSDTLDLIEDDSSDTLTKISNIDYNLDQISSHLSETSDKIKRVREQRDSLLPEIEHIDTGINSMISGVDGMRTALESAKSRIEEIKGKDASGISSPITTKIEPISSQKTHFNSLFPTLLVLIIMITGILLATALVMVEKKSKAFFRNHFTPTSYLTFNLAVYITALLVLLIQLVIFVSVSAFFFETTILTCLSLVMLLVFLISTVFICAGMFVGFLFKTEETANLAAMTLATIFLLFSSALIPLESLPIYMKQIAMFNPFVISELALKQAILFEFSLENMLPSIGMLSAYAVGIFLLLVVLQNALRKLSFMHFSKYHFKIGLAEEKRAAVALADGPVNIDITDNDDRKKKNRNEKHNIDELAVERVR